MAKPKVEKDTGERWLLTYSDLMNLLLILFIILYTSSKLDAQKAQQVVQSINQGFSTIEGTAAANAGGSGSGTGGATKTAIDTAIASGSDVYWETDEYVEFYTEINELLKQNNLLDKVDTTLDDTGVIISFKDSALFPPGNAVINNDALSVIDKISALLTKLDYSFILVEGHTDSDPISTPQYVDNMALSSARAGNVWRELVKCGLPPEEMASIGYGEYRPVAPNDSVTNKSKNRRVVITILKKPFLATANLSGDGTTSTSDVSGTASKSESDTATEAPAVTDTGTAPATAVP
jgi:chemotaxis protein MotB